VIRSFKLSWKTLTIGDGLVVVTLNTTALNHDDSSRLSIAWSQDTGDFIVREKRRVSDIDAKRGSDLKEYRKEDKEKKGSTTQKMR
jgi:hypothetical protein